MRLTPKKEALGQSESFNATRGSGTATEPAARDRREGATARKHQDLPPSSVLSPTSGAAFSWTHLRSGTVSNGTCFSRREGARQRSGNCIQTILALVGSACFCWIFAEGIEELAHFKPQDYKPPLFEPRRADIPFGIEPPKRHYNRSDSSGDSKDLQSCFLEIERPRRSGRNC